MENTYTLVLTTATTEQQANDLAHSIVAAGIAACVQTQPIRSVYRWKGEVCAEPEYLLMIKTTDRRYADLERHIKSHHAYETAEIVQLPITRGSAEYLAWIDESVT